MTRQLNLGLKDRPQWGGRRKGSGRKPKFSRAGVPHRARTPLASRHPVHVTLKLKPDVDNLRTKTKVKAIRRAFRGGKQAFGFRLVHFNIQSNHLHLMAEAKDASALSKGVAALEIRIARTLNRLAQRRGAVFADRFHARALKTPREVRNALAYVLLNANRHAGASSGRCDPCSSGVFFDGWRARPRPPPLLGDEGDEAPVADPGTWLLQVGWRPHGLLRPEEVPG